MPGLQLVQHHERVDGVGPFHHQGVGDLVLDVPGRDAFHPLPGGLLAQLADAVLGVAGEHLAVVELQLLDQGQVRLLRLLQPGEGGPHRGHLDGVGGDVLAPDLGGVVVLQVDLDLLAQLGDVGDVDLDRPVPERLHVLVLLELPVLRLVGVADDHLVDVGLGELLGLDLVLLGGAQEVVEEGHVQLQDLHELDQPPVGHVELAVEVEGAGVRLAPVLGDLPVVDVPGELGGVLVLLVLGLEGADAHPVLLRTGAAGGPARAPGPWSSRPGGAVPAPRSCGGSRGRGPPPGRSSRPRSRPALSWPRNFSRASGGNEVERLLVDGAGGQDLLAVGRGLDPREGVEAPLVGPAVALQPLLEQPHDGALGRAHRAVEQDDPPLGAVTLGRGVEDVHQLHERDVEPVDRVLAQSVRVVEEAVVGDPLLGIDVLVGPVGQDHVVETLVGGPGDLGILGHQVDVVLERPLPAQFAEGIQVLELSDQGVDVDLPVHARFTPLHGARCRAASAGRPGPAGRIGDTQRRGRRHSELQRSCHALPSGGPRVSEGGGGDLRRKPLGSGASAPGNPV